MATNQMLRSPSGRKSRTGAATAEIERPQRSPSFDGVVSRRVAFRPAGTLFTATGTFVWVLALLAGVACVAPWISHGWLLLELIGAIVALAVVIDAQSLWSGRTELFPVLLAPEAGVRGREGQSISIPLAFTGPRKSASGAEVRVAIMPATVESETAIRISGEPQVLKLGLPDAPANAAEQLNWPWTPEVELLRRGIWPMPRVGTERTSRLGLWSLRRWFDTAEPLRIEADMRSGRREILRSPIYRSLVASRQTPWSGHGRDFERLREYQPGDNFSEIAWKTTARRGAPVTRLFQWEQKQEVYFVVDQSRSSAIPLELPDENESGPSRTRAPKRLLDVSVEAALVGATVALELGDEFGLVTYAEEPKSWLRAGSGKSHFQQFRERLLNLEPFPTSADYEELFGAIRVRLRRRAYLVILGDLAERSVMDSLSRGVSMVHSSHVVLITSLLPAHARPAFSADDHPDTDEDVYTILAGEKENQRLGALSRKLGQSGVQLRFVPPEILLRTAVEGYLESKREQRL